VIAVANTAIVLVIGINCEMVRVSLFCVSLVLLAFPGTCASSVDEYRPPESFGEAVRGQAPDEQPQTNNFTVATFCTLRIALSHGGVTYLNMTAARNTLTPVRTDTALVTIENNSTVTTNYSWQHSECYKCPMFSVLIAPGGRCTQRMQTGYPNIIALSSAGDNEPVTSCKTSFRDKGNYTMVVGPNYCHVTFSTNPPNPDLPFLWMVLIFIAMGAVWVFLSLGVWPVLEKLYKRGTFNRLIPCSEYRSEQALSDTTASDDEPVTTVNVVNHIPNGVYPVVANGYGPASIHADDKSTQEQPESHDAESTTTQEQPEGQTVEEPEGQTVVEPPVAVEYVKMDSAPAQPEAPKATTKPGSKQRLVCLDAFRGLSLTVMIFINN
jgi:hypothetical protein